MYVGGSASVVPYIGTWIETCQQHKQRNEHTVVPYIGTWIETGRNVPPELKVDGRTLYRYVD